MEKTLPQLEQDYHEFAHRATERYNIFEQFYNQQLLDVEYGRAEEEYLEEWRSTDEFAHIALGLGS